MSFFKTKLMGVSRDLYLEHGWEMPRGIAQTGARDPTNFTLAEWQQAKRQGLDPRWLKASLQDCWKRSDNAPAFVRSLEEHGFFLVKGDKRGHVVLDHNGEVYSLPRMLGLKTKEVRARLGDGAELPGVEATKAMIGARMTPAIRRHIEESRARFQQRSAALGTKKEAMTQEHRAARVNVTVRQEMEWLAETRSRASRLPKGLRGLWHRVTGDYQKVRAQNEDEARHTRERHAQERQKLIEAQRDQCAVLQAAFKTLRRAQAGFSNYARRSGAFSNSSGCIRRAS